MECIYYPDFTEETNSITIENEEFFHIKALRLRINDNILLTNGKGLIAECIVVDYQKKNCVLNIIKFEKNKGEGKKNIILALGILDNKDRLEFAIEKTVELGISSFIPISTQFSQRKRINITRLENKTIAAMKQTKRATLTKIYEIMNVSEIIETFASEYQIIIADENGTLPNEIQFSNNILLMVGPEGGFSDNEKQIITKIEHTKMYLGNSRLRAETAAIIGTGFAMLL